MAKINDWEYTDGEQNVITYTINITSNRFRFEDISLQFLSEDKGKHFLVITDSADRWTKDFTFLSKAQSAALFSGFRVFPDYWLVDAVLVSNPNSAQALKG